MIRIFLLLLTLSFSAFAEDNSMSNFKKYSAFALGVSGEDLITTTGNDKLTTAGFLYLSWGVSYDIPDTDIELVSAVGFNYDSLEVVEGKFSFKETSVEFVPYYRINNRLRIGLGLFHVISAEISGPIDPAKFANSTGTVLQIDWKTGNKGGWGLRHVDVDLAFEQFNGVNVSDSGVTIDGSYTAIVSYHRF